MPKISHVAERLAGESLRLADRLLPFFILRLLLWPPAAALSAYEVLFARQFNQLFDRLPPSLRLPRRQRLWRMWTRRTALTMGKALRFWPDRLREARWQKRCQIHGLDRLHAILGQGRPVILATLHYGSLEELFHWLRARGFKVCAMARRKLDEVSDYRTHLSLLGDRANGITGVPHFFELDDLWTVRDYLSEPDRILMIALDGYHGKTPLRVRGEDYSLRLARGAFKMAAITNAVVVPCLMRASPGFAAEIQIREPVPENLITDSRQHGAAAEHIVRELLPLIGAQPEQSSPWLLYAFEKSR